MTLCHRVVRAGGQEMAVNGSANQGAMRQALDHLMELGWVRRNSGYGHPLRPEYLLTKEGERLAPAAALIDEAIVMARAQELAFRRWALPIVHVAYGEGSARFSALATALRPATDRAISMTLQRLRTGGAIERVAGDGAGAAVGLASPGTMYVVGPSFGNIAAATLAF